LLRKFLKKVRDKLTGSEDKKEASPPAKTPDNKKSREKSEKPKGQSGARSSKPQDSQRRQSGRRRPSSEKRRPETRPKEREETPPKAPWAPSDFQVEPVEGKTRFHDLDLPTEVMHGIYDLGFTYCTPIQAVTLPKALEGVDVTGKAQTGTGKTAAFLITILTQLERCPPIEKRRPGTPRALIMVPTRELVLQVQKDALKLGKYCRCVVVAVFGGMDYQKQKQMLAEQVVDVVVATPGRLLDFKRQGDAHLSKVEILVIDEADEMLDMGFIPDMRQIIRSTPSRTKRQTMFFGATVTHEVTRLASQWTHDPVSFEIDPEQVAVDTIDQVVYLVTARQRFTLLYNMITQQNLKRVIVFCNRRDQTRRLGDRLKDYGISCAVLSGEVAQKKRIRTVEDFRAGKIRVMVSTDVAGRGIHIEAISHVVNYNLPVDPEDYVHRIGRTGRAGSAGISISFATEEESFHLPAIEEYLGKGLVCVHPDSKLLTPVPRHVARKSSPHRSRTSQPRHSSRGPRKTRE
jgi:ATP-dependent RNA helicase RhlB